MAAAAAAPVPVHVPAVPAPARGEVASSDSTSPDVAVSGEKRKSGPKVILRKDFGLCETHSMPDIIFKPAPHNPPHLFVADTLYVLTASIYGEAKLIESAKRKTEWQEAFHESAKIYEWKIIAWVVLNNHYHAIARSPEYAGSLSNFINSYHKFTARNWNKEDGAKGRKVWWNYWDTCIRSERDYDNRLRYVFWNPVKDGLAEKPEDYSFSNYGEYLDKLQNFDVMSISEVNDVPEF